MSISSIITRGYGSFGTIPLIITRGYVASSTPPVTADTHDGFARKDIKAYRAQLRERQKLIEQREEEKILAAKELRRQLEEAINPPVEADEDIEAEFSKTEEKIAPTEASLENLKLSLANIEREIALLAIENANAIIEARRLQDEEDIQAILFFLSNELSNYSIN